MSKIAKKITLFDGAMKHGFPANIIRDCEFMVFRNNKWELCDPFDIQYGEMFEVYGSRYRLFRKFKNNGIWLEFIADELR